MKKLSRKQVKYQHHKPSSFAYRIVSLDDDCIIEEDTLLYSGSDAAEKFIDCLQDKKQKKFLIII